MKTFLEYFREASESDPKFGNMRLFHGTNVEFDVFDFERFGQTDCGTDGAWVLSDW
ncbi:hypothetical protein [Dickeya phage Kamild]|uniref:Uncharacterized protein n=1 Tax=Dickeya phage Kamild TaxID=2320190 RepID=A0A3G2K9R4_9CAUD|nr:hypothetical protein [Dickeya phage Kamild]